MQTVIPLESGVYYHIYNRGVNRTNIFIEERNYTYFMQLYAKYIAPVAGTFAYCLMKNHFHMLVRIRTDPLGLEDRVGLSPGPVDHRSVSQAFNNWLNAYAKAINKSYSPMTLTAACSQLRFTEKNRQVRRKPRWLRMKGH